MKQRESDRTGIIIFLVIVFAVAGFQAYVTLSGAGGLRDSWSLYIGDNPLHTLRIWMRVSNSFHRADFSSFFVKQDLGQLAATIASKKDQHGKRLKTEIYQDTFILIIQESAENGKNYYIISPNTYTRTPEDDEEDRARLGEYRYSLYMPRDRVRDSSGERFKMAIPYHLLSGINIQPNPYGFSDIYTTVPLAAEWGEVISFYDSISSYSVERSGDHTLLVRDKTSLFCLRVVFYENGGVPRISFAPETPW